MPNWVHNELTVKGSQEDVLQVLTTVRGGKKITAVYGDMIVTKNGIFHAAADELKEENPFDFNRVIPYPQEYRDQDEQARAVGNLSSEKNGFNNGGYEWCEEHWGTKWNAIEAQTVGDTICFDTAWAPPLPIIKQLSATFPTVTFELVIN